MTIGLVKKRKIAYIQWFRCNFNSNWKQKDTAIKDYILKNNKDKINCLNKQSKYVVCLFKCCLYIENTDRRAPIYK